MAEKNGKVKEGNINSKNGFFGEKTVEVKDGRDGDGDNEEAYEFGGEIIRFGAIEKAIHKAPEEGGSKSNFDMFPGRFINSREETDDTVVAGPIITKVSKSAKGRDNNNAKPEDKDIIHKVIIA